MPTPSRDRFDDIPASPGRVGAHRAENPRVRGWTTFLWALGATIVFVAVGIFGALVSQGRIVLFPEVLPSVSPTPSITPVIDTSYTVLVLNGTPEDGLATRTKDTLIAAGWTDATVIASNASDRAFETTTVYYASPDAQAAALGLADLIGATEVIEDDAYPLPDTSPTQLTVVLGLDQLATTPSPTPTS